MTMTGQEKEADPLALRMAMETWSRHPERNRTMNWRKYWKGISTLPGACLVILSAFDVIPLPVANEVATAIGAIMSTLGPVVGPKNAD